MTVLEIEPEVNAIITNAPIRFANTCKRNGIQPNIVCVLMDTYPDTARCLIQRLEGTKAKRQAILDAWELFMAESGRYVYYPAHVN